MKQTLETESASLHQDLEKSYKLLDQVASTQAFYQNQITKSTDNHSITIQNLINDSVQVLSHKINEIPTHFTILCKDLKKESSSHLQETIKQCSVIHQTLAQQIDKQDKRWKENIVLHLQEAAVAVQHHEIIVSCFQKIDFDIVQVSNMIGETLQNTTITSNQLNINLNKQVEQINESLKANTQMRESFKATLIEVMNNINRQFTQLHLQYIAEIGDNYKVTNASWMTDMKDYKEAITQFVTQFNQEAINENINWYTRIDKKLRKYQNHMHGITEEIRNSMTM
jgi:hypothetical protein